MVRGLGIDVQKEIVQDLERCRDIAREAYATVEIVANELLARADFLQGYAERLAEIPEVQRGIIAELRKEEVLLKKQADELKGIEW
jgi:GTP1/Obg family GTP-binding protein